jgi:hypothetical protein
VINFFGIFAFALASLLVPGLITSCHAVEPSIEKERAEVPEPLPVSHAGIRYQVLIWGRARGLPQNGGYVVAIDEKSGKEIWLTQIYKNVDDGDKEQDKQDVFIVSLSLDAGKQELKIENERGQTFFLDLPSRRVR